MPLKKVQLLMGFVLAGSVFAHTNTSISVLLAKGKGPHSVAIQSGKLFYSYEDHAPWRETDASLRVHVVEKKGRVSLSLNGRDSLSPVLWLRPGARSGRLRYDGRIYRGAFRLQIMKEGILLTNVVPVEDYLVGVLAAEMGESWPNEALKAQAVSARTYAYYRLLHPRSADYDIDSSIQDQAYRGDEDSRFPSPRLQSSVTQTQGLVLLEGGKLTPALFHSRCGGHTDSSAYVWRGEKRRLEEAVECPGCRKNRMEWDTAMPVRALLDRVHLPGSIDSFSIRDIERSPSGRVMSVTLTASDREKRLTGDELRALVGYARMKSARFDWTIGEEGIRFQGQGAGHGVGLCQWGARYLATQGKDYSAILKHYYPLRKVTLWPLSRPVRALAKS